MTGITGFQGSHLADYLLDKNIEVYGIARTRSKLDNIKHIGNKIVLLNGDIRDGFSMKEIVRDTKPDFIFHLASQSFVPESWKAPLETLYTNIIGTLNILEAVKDLGLGTIVQVAGTSEEYGLVKADEFPIKEINPLRPISPYGVSKVAADLLAQQYYRSFGLNIIVTRCFNTEGPRRGEVFVTSYYAKRIAEIEKGKREPILKLGNMEAERDFTDVRDVVKALWLLVDRCPPGGVYNICSGVSRRVMYVVDYLVNYAHLEVKLEEDPKLLRPSDVPKLQGDSSKFRAITGWKPTITFEKTLEDLLNYWRSIV